MTSTLHTRTFDGIPCNVPNTTQDHKGYYISYNNYDISIYGSDTTALVLGQMEKFYILNGDHRKAYEACKSFEECLEYFKTKPELISKHSDKA